MSSSSERNDMDGGGFDLADDSIFNDEDYNQMHRIVSDETAREIP